MIRKNEKKLEEELEDVEEMLHRQSVPSSKTYFWFGFVTGLAALAIVGLAFMAFGRGSYTTTYQGGGVGDSGNDSAQVAGQKTGNPITLVQFAKAAGADEKEFNDCFAKKEVENIVNADYQEGLEKGVRGTPGNFINGYSIAGAVPFEQMKAMIDQLLAGEKPATEEAPVGFKIEKGDHVRGTIGAPIMIVEFSDFQCPFCARFHPTMQRAMEEYKGKVSWVYKHFPLDSIHPMARPTAIASECVYEQEGDDGFWKFADEVFGKQEQLSL